MCAERFPSTTLRTEGRCSANAALSKEQCQVTAVAPSTGSLAAVGLSDVPLNQDFPRGCARARQRAPPPARADARHAAAARRRALTRRGAPARAGFQYNGKTYWKPTAQETLNRECKSHSPCVCKREVCWGPGVFRTQGGGTGYSSHSKFEKTGLEGDIDALANAGNAGVVRASGVTLAQCKQRCEDGANSPHSGWDDCIGFVRSNNVADSASHYCWFVKAGFEHQINLKQQVSNLDLYVKAKGGCAWPALGLDLNRSPNPGRGSADVLVCGDVINSNVNINSDRISSNAFDWSTNCDSWQHAGSWLYKSQCTIDKCAALCRDTASCKAFSYSFSAAKICVLSRKCDHQRRITLYDFYDRNKPAEFISFLMDEHAAW